jgi:hypothetical protein
MVTRSHGLHKIAFKEWDVIVRELLSGQQILILRKGGIHERQGKFQLSHQDFFIFPTLLHQSEGDKLKSYLKAGSSLPSAAETIPIQGYAKVVWYEWVSDLARIEKLDPYHGWSPECIRERFEWGDEPGLFVIAVRVYRLPETLDLPNDPKYGGCRSWIEFSKGFTALFPPPVAVLSDQEFQKRSDQIKQVLRS